MRSSIRTLELLPITNAKRVTDDVGYQQRFSATAEQEKSGPKYSLHRQSICDNYKAQQSIKHNQKKN